MDFSLSDEQRLIIKTTRDFVTHELMPHEREVEETGILRPELQRELKAKAIEAGLYAANMPSEVGGAGLDTVTWVLYEKELGRTGYALHYNCVGRPSNILCACVGEQRELLSAVEADEFTDGPTRAQQLPQTPVREHAFDEVVAENRIGEPAFFFNRQVGIGFT